MRIGSINNSINGTSALQLPQAEHDSGVKRIASLPVKSHVHPRPYNASKCSNHVDLRNRPTSLEIVIGFAVGIFAAFAPLFL